MAATAVGTRTNERPGTRAQMRFARFSASKARAVLDLVRGLPVSEAAEVLQFTERGPSVVIAKVLASAIANAEHNDELDGDSLYVSACYADEGPTLKRWRPRARGRATRIRKRTCHITIIVSTMPDEMAARVEARQAAAAPARRRGRRAQESRRARVARSRGETVTEEPTDEQEPAAEVDEAAEAGGEPTDEMVEDAEEAAEPTADENADDEADELGEAESTEDDESEEERGSESAGGGGGAEGAEASPEAEGDASTEAKDEK
jgi:large subunit ribosomal protein L22